MIYDKLEFHNVAELVAIHGHGLRLQRVPEQVRQHLNEGAQTRMIAATATEIRFVAASDTVRITLSCPTGACELIPFFGPFQGNQRIPLSATPQTIELSRPERFKALQAETASILYFSPEVWRLRLRGNTVHYHDIAGDGLRPPAKAQLPKRRYLAYGTSITDGAAASADHLTYVAQTAWHLQADLINLGVGGSAYCEPELADYIAERDDWHFATLALSVNMIGAGFSDEEFCQRTRYMIDPIAKSAGHRPIACITIYPHFRDFAPQEQGLAEHSERFRKILRQVVAELNYDNVILVEGPDLLKDIGGLTVDLIHPGDQGMIQMGQRLAAKLRPLLEHHKI